MYRVYSEEQGVLLLNMIVCRLCYEQAKELGLDGEEIKIDESCHQSLPADSLFIDKSVRTR